jgi:hypothetical protein
MTMHLAHPSLSLGGKRKGKKKFRNAAEAQKARELDNDWKELQKKWDVKLTTCQHLLVVPILIISLVVLLKVVLLHLFIKSIPVPRFLVSAQCTSQTLCLSLVTKKHKILRGCAVAKYGFYYKIIDDDVFYEPGVYALYSDKPEQPWQPELTYSSVVIWREGPRGGILKIQDRRYVGENRKWLFSTDDAKEFMWAKLQSESFRG